MKELSVILILLMFLVGCSSDIEQAGPAKDNTVTQKENREDDFISATIESSEELQQTTENLKPLLNDLDVMNSTWQTNVYDLAEDITWSLNGYALATSYLSEDQHENKYADTIELYEQGRSELTTISDDLHTSLDTYDKKLFSDISKRLDPAMQKIYEAIKHLEEERYE